jgi:hypothetical protein
MPEHSCPVTATVGTTAYQCRDHSPAEGGGTLHHFGAHWPACPAPWCLKEPGHRDLHDIPWGTPVLKDGQGNMLATRKED